MAEAEFRLRYRKKGALAWRELTPGAMPDHGELWEVQSPDGSVALLSRSDAPPPAPPAGAEETDSFHLEFAQESPAPGGGDIPVTTLGALGSEGLAGAMTGRVARPPDLTDPKAFGVLVEGDGLEPKFAGGQVVLVAPSQRPADGDWAVVRPVRGEPRIARWRVKRPGKVFLESPKPSVKPLDIAADQVRFAFKILWAKFP